MMGKTGKQDRIHTKTELLFILDYLIAVPLKIVYTFGGSPRVNHTLYGEPPFDYSSYLEWRRK